MKRHLTKLSELQKTLLICGIINGILILGSLVGLFFNQPGWLIGALLGTVCEIVNIVLLNIGANATLKDNKMTLSLVFYLVRMIIFAGFFIMLVVFQYKLDIDAFKYSPWGMLITFLPSTLIVVISQLKFGGKE